MSDQDKQRYRGPEIVDAGDVRTVTTAGSAPVRDNPGIDPADWDNPNPPKPEEESPEPEPTE